MKTTNATRIESINADDYSNNVTGEVLSSELEVGARVQKITPTGFKVINYKNFVCSRTTHDKYVMSILSAADYRRYRHIACGLHTDFNIVLSEEKTPHTAQSLAKELEISLDETTRLIRRLEKADLAKWSVIPKSGYQSKVLVFNPHVIAKRTRFDKDFVALFPDFEDVLKAVPAPKKKSLKKQPAIVE